jgi:hypothetical protein
MKGNFLKYAAAVSRLQLTLLRSRLPHIAEIRELNSFSQILREKLRAEVFMPFSVKKMFFAETKS